MCIWGKCQWETITSIMLLHTVVDYLPSLQNRCTKLWAKCVNKFGTENNFILDYLSESSRHEASILSKWVWIFSPYPPYTTTWYNTPLSCSQIAMSPQNVLSVRSVSSVSVVILIWRLCQNIISIASNNLQNKFIQNYGIEILKRKEKCRWETIHSLPL